MAVTTLTTNSVRNSTYGADTTVGWDFGTTNSSSNLNIVSSGTNYTIPVHDWDCTNSATTGTYALGDCTWTNANYISNRYSTRTNEYTGYDINNVCGLNNWSTILDDWNTYGWEKNPTALKKSKIRGNLIVITKSRACPIAGVSPAEQKALDTLREMISESDYRKYIKHGFLMVCGSDRDMYQVFRTQSHTKVWRDGKVIEEICVRIKDFNVPPTDNVIAFKTLIEINSEAFKLMGNRFPIANNQSIVANNMYRLAA
jgi:hypothetical protein